mgnify:FL=1
MNSSPSPQNKFLKTIVGTKREEIDAAKRQFAPDILRSQAECTEPPRDFLAIFSASFACIAEIKRASPSRGTFTEDFQAASIAREYERGGASAISVLTDGKFFGGSLDDIRKVRNATSLPVLRKEFIIDEYQIYQARVYGADAILLISEILTENELRRFIGLAEKLGMASIVEGHTGEEIEKAKRAGAKIIGVNNRDLETFSLHAETSLILKPLIPDRIIAISESGIKTSEDLQKLKDAGYRGALIGEVLMVHKDREVGLRRLLEPLKQE